MENKIYKAITDIMNEIGVVGKTSKNTQQGFMYRGIDSVMNAINPALVKHKVFIVPEVLEQIREERQSSRGGTLLYSICKMKYTFYADDGSNISAVVVGEGMDSGDKATNKAMSIAFKYACFQVFCIPTEEMIDPDAEVHDVAHIPQVKKIGADEIANIKEELIRTGVSEDDICKRYNIKAITEMTMPIYNKCMQGLAKSRDKENAGQNS